MLDNITQNSHFSSESERKIIGIWFIAHYGICV